MITHRKARNVGALADGAVHVWAVARPGGSDPVAAVLSHYGRPGEGPAAIFRGSGKPTLEGWGGDLRFNVARAPDLLLVAVARGREVGVDVERRGRGPWLSLPGHVLTARELRSLEGVPEAVRDAAFLRLWTRKEAVLKAAGVGLAVDPALVEVSGADEPAVVLGLPASIGPAARYGLLDLELAGYTATVAVERPHGTVTVLRGAPDLRGALTKSLRLRDLRLTLAE